MGAGWLWIALKWAFSWQPIKFLIIPWWGFIVAFGLLAYGIDKLFAWLENNNLQELKEVKPEDFQIKCRRAWKSLFVSAIVDSMDLFRDIDLRRQCPKGLWPYVQSSIQFFKHSIVNDVVDMMYGKQLDGLSNRYPDMSKVNWREINKENYPHIRLALLGEQLGITLGFDYCMFNDAVKKLYVENPNMKQGIDKYALDLQQKEMERRQRKEARKQGWMHQTCLKWTSAIGDGALSFWGVISRVSVAICHLICVICKNIATFCAYMWMLAKAKKQGACPYFRFEDPKQ